MAYPAAKKSPTMPCLPTARGRAACLFYQYAGAVEKQTPLASVERLDEERMMDA